MDPVNSTITLTFGDQAENHVGMQKLGQLAAEGAGFNKNDLLEIQNKFEKMGAKATLHDLNVNGEYLEAYLLVISGGINSILGGKYSLYQLFDEQASLEVDKRALMYGRVVNKKARWNLCFDDVSQDPDYENGKGTIVALSDVPITNFVVSHFGTLFGPKSQGLKGEGNYYFDINKCGIGFHGDAERRKVIALRLGAPNPIYFQWWENGAPLGQRLKFDLDGGDIYIMSEKAVGTDWKKRKIKTLRHAVGAANFINVP